MNDRHLRAVQGAGDAAARTSADAGDTNAPGEQTPDDIQARAERAARLAELLERTGRGDAGSYEELYNLVAGSVYGVALRVVRDPAMAEDVAQEALTEVWHLAARFDPSRGSARSWILTIAHRRAIDRVRSEQSHSDRVRAHGWSEELQPEQQDHVVDIMYREWEAVRVRSGLSALTPLQREALELTYYKGYTHREVAQSLGVPLGTAKARVRDGLLRLRDRLGEGR